MYRSHGLRGNTAVDALRTLLLKLRRNSCVSTDCIPKPERGNDEINNDNDPLYKVLQPEH